MKKKLLIWLLLTVMFRGHIFGQPASSTGGHVTSKSKVAATVPKAAPEMGIVPITCLTLFVIFHLCCLGAWAIKSAAIDEASEGKGTGKRLY